MYQHLAACGDKCNDRYGEPEETKTSPGSGTDLMKKRELMAVVQLCSPMHKSICHTLLLPLGFIFSISCLLLFASEGEANSASLTSVTLLQWCRMKCQWNVYFLLQLKNHWLKTTTFLTGSVCFWEIVNIVSSPFYRGSIQEAYMLIICINKNMAAAT